jgi:uncharacterized protein YndB with AHSA1/START domain
MSDRTIELTTEIEAPPEVVFRALTDADVLSRWWTTRAESDPRTGGSFSYTWEFEEQTERDHTRTDTYADVTADEHVRYDWPMPLGPTVVDFRLQPRDGGTTLVLAHEGWGAGADWDESYEMHVGGWKFFLGNLKTYLEQGEDRRAEAMGLKTPASV